MQGRLIAAPANLYRMETVDIVQKLNFEADTSVIDVMNDKLKELNATLEKTVELLKQVNDLKAD